MAKSDTDKILDLQEFLRMVSNMCHTVKTKPEYSRVDLAEKL